MILSGLGIFALFAALVGALLAGTSRSSERLLWGAVISSVGLASAVLVGGGGYYGVVMLAAFLVTDLVVYLSFRNLSLVPARPPENPRADRGYRIFFLWVALVAIGGGVGALFQLDLLPPAEPDRAVALALLHDRVWAADGLLFAIPVFCVLMLVMGGFFLVRRDR